jgi:hypothetical protein
MSIQLRRGTNAERALITPSEGELIYTTDTKILYVGDGSTLGGNQVSLSSTSVLQGQISGDLILTPHRITGGGISINSATGNITASVFNGAFNGSIGSNLSIGTKSITNGGNLTINGGTGVITASRFNGNITGNVTGNLTGNVNTGLLSITGSTLNSSNSFTSDDNNTIGKIYIEDYNQLIINSSDGTVAYSIINSITLGRQCAHIDHQIARGSLAAPARVQTGDVLLNYRVNAYDGTSPILSSAIQFSIDNAATVSSGHTPGKIILANMIDTNTVNAKILSFDSFGRLGVNKFDATETLDVNGTAKFSGYVVVGSYSNSQRNALTPVNGMMIYNRIANRFQGYQNGAWINLDNGTAVV